MGVTSKRQQIKRVQEIKRVYLFLENTSSLSKKNDCLLIEQMLDMGDAKMEPLGSDEMFNHKVTTLCGDTYFVWAEEVPSDGPDLAEHSDGHHRCGVASGFLGMDESSEATLKSRACSLLDEALNWIGAVNLNQREEAHAHNLQKRIARLLAEARACSE